MKRIVIVCLIAFSILFIYLYVSFKWKKGEPCIPEPPKRIGSIPSNAKWIGGCDGGFWFEIVSINSNSKKYRIKIFDDYKGDLIIDEYYTIAKNCNKNIAYENANQLLLSIVSYDFESIQVNNGCSLIEVK